MKILILSDGTELEFTNESSTTNMVMEVEKFADVDDAKSLITVDNLNGAKFDNEPISELIPVEVSARVVGGKVVVTFTNRFKTEEEKLKEQILELQVAVADMTEALMNVEEEPVEEKPSEEEPVEEVKEDTEA